MNNIEENIKLEFKVLLYAINDYVSRSGFVEDVICENSKVSHRELIRVGDHLIRICNTLDIDVSDNVISMLYTLKDNYDKHYK